jgi:hypothetical protein
VLKDGSRGAGVEAKGDLLESSEVNAYTAKEGVDLEAKVSRSVSDDEWRSSR